MKYNSLCKRYGNPELDGRRKSGTPFCPPAFLQKFSLNIKGKKQGRLLRTCTTVELSEAHRSTIEKERIRGKRIVMCAFCFERRKRATRTKLRKKDYFFSYMTALYKKNDDNSFFLHFYFERKSCNKG